MGLSDKQISLHWRTWGAVVEAHDWRMEKTRLVGDLQQSALKSIWHKRVIALAEMLARQNARAVTPDDLRKATYALALGKVKSLTQFDNRDLDRTLAVMRLLRDPEDLEAVMTHMAYERGEDPGERRRLLAGIRQKAPEAYIAAVSKGKFGTEQWEGLDLPQLRHLNITLNNRKAVWHRPALERELDAENAPF